MPRVSPGALFRNSHHVCLLPCCWDWTGVKRWVPDHSSATYWDLLELLGEYYLVLETCYCSFYPQALKSLQFTLLFETVSQTCPLQRKAPVLESLYVPQDWTLMQGILWVFSLLKLYFHRAPLLHLHHLSALQTIWQTSGFLMCLKMALLLVFMPLASCSSKPFLACQWFYIYGLHLTY